MPVTQLEKLPELLRLSVDLQARLERIEASLKSRTTDDNDKKQAGEQPDAPTDIRCYTVEEAAKILRLGLSVTYANIQAGRIPAVKLGGRWLIPHTGIARLLQGEQG
jgi:excisionase family DNA binding protein